MKILFISALEFGYNCIEKVLEKKWNVVDIFTMDDGFIRNASGYVSFDGLSKKYDAPVFKTHDINSRENVDKIKNLEPDVIFVLGWSQIVSNEVIEIPKLACIGHHPTLLPKHRGNAPIPWSIIMGLSKSGVTFFHLTDKVDAGYLHIPQPKFVNCYKWRIMNIHPAILPAFQGTIHAQQEAVEYGAKISGCTVHFIDESVDTGPIIIQATVPVKDDDTEETLSQRILEFEHVIYPKAIKMFSEGRLKVEEIESNLRKIGVTEDAFNNFLEKAETFALLVKDITQREAMILKPEMLALEGDCTVPQDCVLNSLVPVSVVVTGNKRQLKKLAKRLEKQTFDLPAVAEKIAKVIG